jgi:hypothetical protein
LEGNDKREALARLLKPPRFLEGEAQIEASQEDYFGGVSHDDAERQPGAVLARRKLEPADQFVDAIIKHRSELFVNQSPAFFGRGRINPAQP